MFALYIPVWYSNLIFWFDITIDIPVNLCEHNPGLKITIAELKRLFAFATSGTCLFLKYNLWPNRWYHSEK